MISRLDYFDWVHFTSMIPEWKTFLANQGADLGGADAVRFGEPRQETRAAAEATVLCDLSHLSLIRVRGADTRSFLQGQLTNDVQSLESSHSQLNGYCNPKGRMLAVLRLFQHGNDILIQLPGSLQESILKRLKMYVLRAKAQLSSIDEAWHSIGLAGPDAEGLLNRHVSTLPDSPNGVAVIGQDSLLLRVTGTQPRFILIAPPSTLISWWKQLRPGTTVAAASAWRWLDIMAGIPTIYPDTMEVFVPQMANMELLGGVHFNKGCYTGQEIVARMHYLGKLKQRMFRAHVPGNTLPQPGDPIYVSESDGQQKGTVVDAQPSPEDGFEMLAVIQIESADARRLHLSSIDGPRIELRSLPYSLAMEQNPA